MLSRMRTEIGTPSIQRIRFLAMAELLDRLNYRG
jgi:hypothetical protein